MTDVFLPEDSRRRRWRIGFASAVAVAVLALAATVATGVLQQAGAASDIPVPSVSATNTGTETGPEGGMLTVHVSGAVTDPGVYVLEPGSRVMDAVAAAGGFRADAAPNGVNLARALADGEQILVTAEGEAQTTSAEGGAGTAALIDLNTASAADLETLPRVGPALAQRILDWRAENGRFSAVEDLLDVSGIGEKMFAAIEPLVRV
ncbi:MULTISPECIES: ComEA family DNA-binding protein [Microbacterium]|uniref:ComEA family DNA-binding protein n=1 Tax=Microbacterium TaxID=33882 RepID=UPI001E43D5B1|nr:ComEA family DNA-binding protein [Microbacterium nymphoidis]MCD2499238.1 ComEA family DNA-binding protein [Microbacterium nymphoidis]